MKVKASLILTLFIIATLILSLNLVFAEDAVSSAAIRTDKADYSPEETVTIFGSGFSGLAEVTVTVTRPDGSVDPPAWIVNSDESGNFETAYLLDGILGTYTVVATDGTNTATTTFYDPPPPPNIKIMYEAAQYQSYASRMIFGDIEQGTSLDFDVNIQVAGTYTSVTWQLRYATTDTQDNTDLSPETTGLPASGTNTGSSQQPARSISIDTSDLDLGTYVGHLEAVGTAGDTADPGNFYFEFTVTTPSAALEVSKTVSTSYTRTYTWTISKDVSPDTLYLFAGDFGTSEYTITITKTGHVDSARVVSGTITVHNPAGVTATIEGITDVVSGPYTATVTGPGFPYSLAAGGTEYWTYSATLPDLTTRTNTVTVTTSGAVAGGSDVKDVIFGSPTTEVNSEINVDDPDGGSWLFTDSGSASYKKNFFASTDPADYTDGFYQYVYTNTATIRETGDDDGAPVEVNCYSLLVEKTVETSYTRTYTWEIDKVETSDLTHLYLYEGAVHTANYEVTVDADYIDSDWAVTGTITVSNPAPMGVVIIGISDIVSPDIVADVDGPDFPYTLAAESSEEWTYSADLEDATQRTNTATVTIENNQWNIEGDWVIEFEYLGGYYPHDAEITQSGNTLTGVGGGYLAGALSYDYAWDLTSGSVDGDDMEFTAEYTYGAVGTTMHVRGTINPDGSMVGEWDDDYGGGLREGTWESTSGSATKRTTDFSSDSEDVIFGDPTTLVDESIDVNDDKYGDLGTVDYEDDLPYTFPAYALDIGPYEDYGAYTFTNTASFVACDTGATDSSSWTVDVYVVPTNIVTSSSFCPFDLIPGTAIQDFKLIFTSDPASPSAYWLAASNPGQFYYNVFYIAGEEDTVDIVINIDPAFVTQGANPVHLYSDIDFNGVCFVPVSPLGLSKDDYTISGDTITINDVPVPSSGFIYVTVHLDYEAKKVGDWVSDTNLNAISTIPGRATIPVGAEYTFSYEVDLTGDSATVASFNTFKKNPGFAGFVFDGSANPIVGATVQLKLGNTAKATATTDSDGFYFIAYKHTGKATDYKLIASSIGYTPVTWTVSVKANTFYYHEFTLNP